MTIKSLQQQVLSEQMKMKNSKFSSRTSYPKEIKRLDERNLEFSFLEFGY